MRPLCICLTSSTSKRALDGGHMAPLGLQLPVIGSMHAPSRLGKPYVS